MFKQAFVLDTDLFIDLLRGVPEAKVFFEKIKTREYLVYYSTILEVEIFAGQSAGSPEEEKTIRDVLELMTRLDIDGVVAKKAGEFRRKYNCFVPDAIIAASAVTHKIHTVATMNKKHFETIPDIKVFEPY
ncbi:MAG: type II toxin-antitoxin system VapC family toxin [Nanoarchaeota archaeon]